jgi:hypothetical protein
VDPSSLIFLAIIAIWGAYLVGQWVRRRDQLATARSIDRFSEAMRVLERRTPTRPVTAARPTARSYVVAPIRVPASGARAVGASRAHGPIAAAPGRTPGAASLASSVRARVAGTAPRAGVPSGRPRITREAARRRARLVLGLVVVTAVAWLLVASTAVIWWPAAGVSALLAAVLVQMRRTARPARQSRQRLLQDRSARPAATRPSAGSTARRPAGRSRSRSRRGLASRVPAPARRPRLHEDARSVLEKVSATRRSDTVAVATGPDVLTSTELTPADVGPGLAHSEPAGLPLGGESTMTVRDGWQPVPVPPPTYTLKPKARPVVRRPLVVDAEDDLVDVATAAPAGGSAPPRASQRDDVQPATPEPEPAAPAFDLDEILERRIASGS